MTGEPQTKQIKRAGKARQPHRSKAGHQASGKPEGPPSPIKRVSRTAGDVNEAGFLKRFTKMLEAGGTPAYLAGCWAVDADFGSSRGTIFTATRP